MEDRDMTRRILITPEGEAFLDGDLHDATGYALEADMDPHDNLPAHVTPLPDEWPVMAWQVAR